MLFQIRQDDIRNFYNEARLGLDRFGIGQTQVISACNLGLDQVSMGLAEFVHSELGCV